jgi:hypothetical protein
MRTEAEQIEALKIVRLELWKKHSKATAIVLDLGDVVALHVGPDRQQIVCVVGGYDGWKDGKLKKADMTLEDAVEWAGDAT